MVYTDCNEIDWEGRVIARGSRQATQFSTITMLAQFITFHMRCIRRSHYDLAGGYRPGYYYAGDYDLSLRLSETGGVMHIPLALYNYRIHDSNTSSLNREATMRESLEIARSSLYRQGLALSYYIRQPRHDRVILAKLGWPARAQVDPLRNLSFFLGEYTQWM